jgi:hypothetical protein
MKRSRTSRFERHRDPPAEEIAELKRRQGRSFESRKKADESLTEISFEKKKIEVEKERNRYCSDCNSNLDVFGVTDSTSNETVCTRCGLVVLSGRIYYSSPWDQGERYLKTSVPYQTVNYARERLGQLSNHDPWVWDDEFREIAERVAELPEQQRLRLGKIGFGKICREIGLSHRKYGERWIQLRIRLNLPMPDYQTLSAAVVDMLSDRVDLLHRCYKKHFANQIIDGVVFRTNVICLNYVFIQCLRMENKWVSSLKRYIYISYDRKKLKKYNAQWKLIIEKLKTDYRVHLTVDKEGTILRREEYEWSFTPLKLCDVYIANHFI